MRRIGWIVAVMAATISARPSAAQTVEFIEPAEGIVRGTVPVQVDLGPGNAGGYVMFYLGEAAKPLRFHLSTLADKDGLFGFRWETQSQRTNIDDGEYRVLAVGYNAADEVIGQASRTFEVQNKVPTSQLPTEGILLRHNLTPGREYLYEAHTDTQEVTSDEKGADLGLFRNGCDATWMMRFIRRDAGGLAQVRNTIYGYHDRSAGGASKPLFMDGEFLTFGLNSQGDTVAHKEYTDTDFPYGEMNIELPSGKMKIGDVWRSRMRILFDPGRSRSDLITATHTIKSVQWYGGFKCAIIESTFEAGPYRTVLESIDAPKPAGGGMGGASGGPSAGGAGAGAQTKLRREVTSVIKNGKRTTYFAYQPEVGRVLRMEETQEHHLSLAVEKPQEQNQMGGGMMGGPGMSMPGYPGGSMPMPGYPGGSMPGMMPGSMPGMMPGMQPGSMPGMMPGAMPGAMPGMMPGAMPGAMPGMMPGAMPGAMPGMMPGAMPGYGSGSGGMMMPGYGEMGGAMGGPGGAANEPPKYIITYVTRRVRTEIQQSYLDQR